MPPDDYYVIAYRLLKYLYDCLKRGDRPKEEALCADALDLPDDYWAYIIGHLAADGYIEGVNAGRYLRASGFSIGSLRNIAITPKGIEHLHENSLFQKIKGHVKDIADSLPG